MSAADTANPFDVQLATALGNDSSTAVRLAGVFTVKMWGTFGGGTYKVQLSPDGGTTWLDYPNSSLTDPGVVAPVFLGQNELVRITGSGGTSNSVTVTAAAVP